MQNDDLGQFPTPTTSTPPVFEPTPDNLGEERRFAEASPLGGKETPDDLQSSTIEPRDTVTPIAETAPQSTIDDLPVRQAGRPSTQPTPATLPISVTSPTSSLFSLVLIIVAGVGITGSVFLYSQSSALKRQLTDITQTLERQKTVLTPSPTPSIIEIPEPTPVASESSIILTPILTPTATPTANLTPTLSKTIMPIALAPQALKVGINHQPNAQLILIKAENAQDPANSLIKYFFRNDLTTKKYFYVAVNGKNESEVVDKSIYVNPDNNIPTLNDLVLGNKLGIDFDEALGITTKLCPTDLCKNASIKAQFIKSGDKTIWQLSLTPTDSSKGTLVIQIDSKTKEVIFKSANFN